MRPSRSTPGGAFAALAGFLAAFIVALTGQAALAEPYRLQPGDSLRLSVSSLPDVGMTAVIDAGGSANFLRFGAFAAADRTLAEVQADVRAATDGLVLKRFLETGEASFVTVTADEVFVDVAAYQPIYVTGDVVSPRAVDFRPGLTLRAAVAAAGGPSRRLAAPTEDFSRTIPRLQLEFSTAAIGHAALVARQWRVEAELAGERDPAPPRPDAVSVGADLFDEAVASQRRQLALAFEQADSQRAFLAASLAQAQERKRILEQQGGNQEAAVKDDEEEQRRVAGLVERGVAPMTRMLDVRRVLLLSSTRLLETQNNLARVNLEITNFERQLKAFDEDRERRLTEERADVRQRALEGAARLTAVRELLEASGAAPLAPGAGAEALVTAFTLHRRVAGIPTSAPADPDMILLPGDVIEVSVALPALTAAP
jgi:polysaccharide export outer membrane protein